MIPTPDLGASYRDTRLRIAGMVSGDVGSIPVPATPAWDVHDVIAHLAGIAVDASTGNMDGVTSDAWTAAQVARGRGLTVAELVDLWSEHAGAVEGFLTAASDLPGGVADLAVIDVVTHEFDLANALGVDARTPVGVVAWCAGVLRNGFADAVQRGGADPVDVDTADVQWLRGRLGRRTVDEVRSYRWSTDPAPYLDTWFVFGRAASPLGERPWPPAGATAG